MFWIFYMDQCKQIGRKTEFRNPDLMRTEKSIWTSIFFILLAPLFTEKHNIKIGYENAIVTC